METRTNKFFEVGIRFAGMRRRKERMTVAVKAESFGQAESIAMKMLKGSSIATDIRTVRISPCEQVVPGDCGEPWFDVRCKLQNANMPNGSGQNAPRFLLIQAGDVCDATKKASVIARWGSPVEGVIMDGEYYG